MVKLTIPREFFNQFAGMRASQKTVNSIYLTSKLYGHFGTQTALSYMHTQQTKILIRSLKSVLIPKVVLCVRRGYEYNCEKNSDSPV